MSPYPENPHYVKGSIKKVLNKIHSKENEKFLSNCLLITQVGFSSSADFKAIIEELEEHKFQYTITLV